MENIQLTDLLGVVKARIKFPVYDEETVAGQKTVTENLGYVKGGNADTAKVIINSFMNLYDVHELDTKNTTVTYSADLDSYIMEIQEDEYSIVTPDNTNWLLTNNSIDQLGNKYKKNWGYINGDLTPEKAEIFNSLVRAMINLSNNTYSSTELSAIYKPYEE